MKHRGEWMVRAMIQRCSRIQTMFSMVVVLCLFMASSGFLAPVWAAKQAQSASEHPCSLNLMVIDRKLSGCLNDRPLTEILDFMSETMGFKYVANKQVRAERVSHKFDQVPLMEAAKKILAPFNYMIETDGSGKIKHLLIIGLRERGRFTTTTLGAKTNEGYGVSDEPAAVLPGEDLVFERHLSLMGDGGNDSGPPIEMIDAFYAQQQPGTEDTGPPVPEGHIAKEFNYFEPTKNMSGPMAPDNVMVEPPEFEPAISDTGPWIENTE